MQKPQLTVAFSIAGTFITYFSMYAFRKPFLAGQYQDLELAGIDYKILLIITQVIGYTLSKFVGIREVAAVQHHDRIGLILKLILGSWIALLFMGLTPYPYNFIWLFFNGLALGMIWGLVFSFIEGKRNTEFLAATLASSFIIASGVVKSTGVSLMLKGVSEFWMPFMTGLVFVPFLLLGVLMLSKIPGQTKEDIRLRTHRIPMDGKQRIRFLSSFAPGVLITTIIYMTLNAMRDFRDNFAVELWAGLGYPEQPAILTLSEIPIAVLCLLMIGLMIYIKDNRKAFYLNIILLGLSGAALLTVTFLFETKLVNPVLWMILVGSGMYMAYMLYHTMLFERWIALFKYKSNVGFLMYISDAFGYSASVAVMLYKDLGSHDLSWVAFFSKVSYLTGFIVMVMSALGWIYFRKREQQERIRLATLSN